MKNMEEKSLIPPHFVTQEKLRTNIYHLVYNVMPSIKLGGISLLDFVKARAYHYKDTYSSNQVLLDLVFCITGIPFIQDAGLFYQVYRGYVEQLAEQLGVENNWHSTDVLFFYNTLRNSSMSKLATNEYLEMVYRELGLNE